MTKLLDTVLLFALPASGKSEVRKYLDGLTPTQCREDFLIGPTLQLDDYPYVHLMRRVDEELQKRGRPFVYYKGGDRPFQEPYEWLTLIELLNEDYADLRAGRTSNPASAAQALFDRLDAAHVRVGLPEVLGDLPHRVRRDIAETMEAECAAELAVKNKTCSQDLTGKTIFIEAARGGPNGAAFPLTPPRGYESAFNQLSTEILDRASVLYIWVTPEESRRKNIERGRPDGQGSILHHSAPYEVMLGDYGCDDMEWLISQSDKPNTVKVSRTLPTTDAAGNPRWMHKNWHLPIARFDNRADLTTFVREDRATWAKADVDKIHSALSAACRSLVR